MSEILETHGTRLVIRTTCVFDSLMVNTNFENAYSLSKLSQLTITSAIVKMY